jgi:peptidoglycan hydrolase FlgJ
LDPPVAITPPTDIVLDVARAADPEKYRAAVERLARLRGTTPAPQPFVPAPAAQAAPARAPDVIDVRTTVTRPLQATGGGDRRLDAYGQFEAFVLQTFVQSMLPKNATSVFGSGTAGEVWKSMLAEKMGGELARSGQVGIARRLAAGPTHAVQAASAQTPGSYGPVPPPTSAALVGTPPAAQVQATDPAADTGIFVSERS